MTFGSLFSGIGGIDLGLERAGMTCKWQVEIDPFCRKVLAKHWPTVERFEDVKAVHAQDVAHTDSKREVRHQSKDGQRNGPEQGSEDGHRRDSNILEPVDVIAGGFPCQDVSVAGKKAGIKEGTRSGLWFEFHRIICELRPRYVFVENVPGLLTNGMGRVLGDLAEIGYDAEWEVLSAADVGAPHLRKRVFIVAYPQHSGQSIGGGGRGVPDKHRDATAKEQKRNELQPGFGDACTEVADSKRIGQQRQGEHERPIYPEEDSSRKTDWVNRRGEARGGNGTLNPTWVEWLMGFPAEFTVLKPSETQ